MNTSNDCACNAAPKLIFACSGAADVGAIADQTARKLAREGAGKMYCLAGIGGKVSGIVASTQAADNILAIDGCALSCAKSSLEQAGINNYKHLQIGELGLAKGQSPINEDNINKVFAAAVDRMKVM